MTHSLCHNKHSTTVEDGLTRPLAVVFQIMDKLTSVLHVWGFF